MGKTVKRLTCSALIFFFLSGVALAQSEYLDGWIGQWTVRMDNGSIVTWDINSTWVSDTGKSHIAYGIKNPGAVEFQIYYGILFSKHFYIEATHDTTIYDLPTDFSEYTELVPADDFLSFTAKAGKYPIESGWQGDEEPVPEPGPCVASYLLGEDDPRLDILRQFRNNTLSTSPSGTKMIYIYYAASESIIAVCEGNPAAKLSLKLILESVLRAVYFSCNSSADSRL